MGSWINNLERSEDVRMKIEMLELLRERWCPRNGCNHLGREMDKSRGASLKTEQ